MSEIAVNNNSINPLFRNAVIGIFFSFQIFLLALVAFEFYKTAFILTCAVLGIILLYYFFNRPFIVLPILLLSILAGAIGKSNSGASHTSFVDFIFPILIVVFGIRSLFYSGERKNKYNFIKFAYLIFLVWGLFTTMVANDKILALTFWRNYFAGFIVFLFGVSFIKDHKNIKFFLMILIAWGIILATIEFQILLSLGGVPGGLVKILLNKNMMATSWGKSNYLAAFYVLIIPITLGYLFSQKSIKSRILIAVALVFMFSALIITLSKGGMLSVGIATLIFTSKVIKPKTFIPLVALVVLITIILLLNPLTIVIFKGLSTVESNLSTYSRLNFYEDVWLTFLKNPITGVGLANLGYYSKFKVTIASASAHNIILGTLGETGIVGSLAFISSLIYAYIISFNNYVKEKIEKVGILLWSFFCAFTGVLLHSMMEPNFEGFQFAVMFWASLAVFLKMAELGDEEKLMIVYNSSLKNPRSDS